MNKVWVIYLPSSLYLEATQRCALPEWEEDMDSLEQRPNDNEVHNENKEESQNEHSPENPDSE